MMKRIQHITAAITAAVVISTSAYSIMTFSVQAGPVVAGTGLSEWLVNLILTFGVTYMGNEVVDLPGVSFHEMLEEDVAAYLASEGGKELKDQYAANYHVDVNNMDSLVVTPEIVAMCMEILADYAPVVDDAVAQDVYFVNPLLPENVYIGFNSNAVPGIAVMNGYDASLSHVQFYNTIYFEGYAVGQIDYSEYNGSGSMYYNALRVDYYGGGDRTEIRSRTQYVIGQNGKLSLFGYSNPAYIFSSAGSDLSNDGFHYNHCVVDAAHPLYLAPSAIQPVIYIDGNTKHEYLVYQSGVVWDGETSTSSSGVVTDTGALTSVKSIVGGKDFVSHAAALMDTLVGEDATTKPLVLSPDAIQELVGSLDEYYQTVTKNYYQDTSYIDGDTYIENITNIYEQAAVDYPVIDVPAVDDAGIISSIKAIPGEIAKVLTDVFVPDVAMYRTCLDTFKAKFAFVDKWISYGKDVIMCLFDAEPEIPVIIIDFGKAESKYNYGGITYALDMTWYARFKPLVDDIIVSISYMVFFYWIFKNLPGIISGSVLSRQDQAAVRDVSKFLSEGHKTDNKYDVDDW